MEIFEANTYQELFREDVEANIEIILPLVQKCITHSTNEREILRAVQISFQFGLKVFSIGDLERELLSKTCLAAKKLFFSHKEILEKTNNHGTGISCSQLLKSCLQIITYFSDFFIKLNNIQKITLSQVESFLLSCAEIIHECFCHCNVSEKVYGPLFDSLSNLLTSCFRRSCELLELLLLFLTDKVIFINEDDTEVTILCGLLKWLSKFGLVLMTLDVKTMAKVWKTQVCLIEKYVHDIKYCFNAGDIVSCLSETVLSSVEKALKTNDNQEFSRNMKLACFNLKLVIKFCGVFSGHIKNCQISILNLLISLCRCGLLEHEEDRVAGQQNQELLKQLSFGADPLLSHLISDEALVKEFAIISDDKQLQDIQLSSFVMVCCLVIKKLTHLNGTIRSIWFNEHYNILIWLFKTVSIDEFGICLHRKLPDVLVGGQQKKVNDLYQYILIEISAFTLSTTSKEFPLVERTLLKNILQPKPLLALLATDVWCLLARFSDTDLCMTQITTLYSIFKEFQYETFRVEKCHLMSLIQRLYFLLTERQKVSFLQILRKPPSTESSKRLKLDYSSNFNFYIANDIDSSFWCHIENIIGKGTQMENYSFNLDGPLFENDKQTIQSRILQYWKFDPMDLFNCHSKESILKIICSLTAQYIHRISSENMLTILTKMKKLLTCGKSTSIHLYFTWILSGLSHITFPPDNFQRSIIETTADIFGALLRSENMLVKEKALDVFYNFSHATGHPEIVTLSVNNSPGLKCDVTNYFKKVLTPLLPEFNLKEFLRSLCMKNYCHTCTKRPVDRECAIEPLTSDKKHIFGASYDLNLDILDSDKANVNIEEIINDLKKNCETLIQFSSKLTNVQKVEITNVCESMLRNSR